MSATPTKPHVAERLLQRAHSPDTAGRIFKDRVVTKPLLLRPSSPPPHVVDARARRQQERQKRRELRRCSGDNRPRPLSAKQKRALCVYEIPEAEKKWEIYEGLNRMWQGYMRDILRLEGSETGYVVPANAGPMLVSADFHGAEVEVVRSRCVTRVGLKGIVVKDTKFTFAVITRQNEIKTVPKEHTVFRFEIPAVEKKDNDEAMDVAPPNLIFELHGEQFKNRAPDRANKKFKPKVLEDL